MVSTVSVAKFRIPPGPDCSVSGHFSGSDVTSQGTREDIIFATRSDPVPARFGPVYASDENAVMLNSRLVGLRLNFYSWWNHFKLNSSNPLVRSKAVDSLSGSTDSRDTERIVASAHDKSA